MWKRCQLLISQETFLRFACFQLKVSVVVFSPEGRPTNVSRWECRNFPGE